MPIATIHEIHPCCPCLIVLVKGREGEILESLFWCLEVKNGELVGEKCVIFCFQNSI